MARPVAAKMVARPLVLSATQRKAQTCIFCVNSCKAAALLLFGVGANVDYLRDEIKPKGYTNK